MEKPLFSYCLPYLTGQPLSYLKKLPFPASLSPSLSFLPSIQITNFPPSRRLSHVTHSTWQSNVSGTLPGPFLLCLHFFNLGGKQLRSCRISNLHDHVEKTSDSSGTLYVMRNERWLRRLFHREMLAWIWGSANHSTSVASHRLTLLPATLCPWMSTSCSSSQL